MDLFPASTPTECRPSVYNELNEVNRYWKVRIFDDTCDGVPKNSDQWYRFTGNAGTMMATHCIPKYSCTKINPGWINGDHPNVAYHLVSRTLCIHAYSSCCHKSYQVDIRNCSGYYVYKFESPSECSERHCGVKGSFILINNSGCST